MHMTALSESPDTLMRIGDGHLTGSWCRMVPTGLVMTAPPTEAQWTAFGEGLRVADHAIQFAVGDWLLIGEQHHPTLVDAIDFETGWSESTLGVYRWVAEHVPLENRLGPPLTFSHHQIAARLPVTEQKAWLERAMTGTDGVPWSVRRLKDEISAGRDGHMKLAYVVIVTCADEADQQKVHNELSARGLVCRTATATRMESV